MSQNNYEVEYYDDGLVHSHDWSVCTPPGGKQNERRAAERQETPSRDAM
jgi:hypothetical protein